MRNVGRLSARLTNGNHGKAKQLADILGLIDHQSLKLVKVFYKMVLCYRAVDEMYYIYWHSYSD